MATNLVRRTTKILVLNPNSSKTMTHGLVQGIREMELSQSTEVNTYTAPKESPASINDGNDVQHSAQVVAKDLEATGLLRHYDAVLVACFSVHPLVGMLADRDGEFGKLAVTGIFEASILTCLSLLRPGKKWGIVTTGKFWEEHLTQGSNQFWGTQSDAPNTKFAGVETTGLNAGDFHGGVDPEVVRKKLVAATTRLLKKGDVECVVMGCAGMAGLEEIIRSVAADEYGPEKANELLVVDGVRGGIGLLEQMVRSKRAFRKTS
ncbi:Asp/Glu/hydantoin racemase [Chaetomium sp. MPI-CAGE-AT-0009]|nr:Asp/Glu/hydantoin racemase [Chaetomium sp. MPI-CAGE-AT-0009]